MRAGAVEGGFAVFGGESRQKRRIGPEFLSAPVQLPNVAQNHLGASGEGSNGAANLYVLLQKLLQIANIFSIFPWAHDREPAFLVGNLRTANVEKPRSVGQLNDIVNMSADAGVPVQMIRDILNRHACLGGRRRRRRPKEEECKYNNTHKKTSSERPVR